jgi:hypothetical protein
MLLRAGSTHKRQPSCPPFFTKNREHGHSGETSWFERPSQITSAMSGVALFGQATGLIAMPTATLTSQASVCFPSASTQSYVPPHTPLTIRRTQRVGTSLYLPPDKSSFTTMMATKRRSHIFARSRVIELPLTDRDSGRLLLRCPSTPGVKAG